MTPSMASKKQSKHSMMGAISRRLSPLEKTAMVAGSNSTHDFGGLTPEEIYEELLSKEAGKQMRRD